MGQNCDIIAALSAYITRPIIRRLITLFPHIPEYLHYNRKMRELHGKLLEIGFNIIKYYDNRGYTKLGDKFRNNNYDGIIYQYNRNNNEYSLSLYNGYNKSMPLNINITIIDNKLTYMRLDEITIIIHIHIYNDVIHIIYYNHSDRYNEIASIIAGIDKTMLYIKKKRFRN